MVSENGRVLPRAKALLPHLAPIPACLGTALLIAANSPTGRLLAGGLLLLALAGAVAGAIGAWRRSAALDRLVRWAGEFGRDLRNEPPTLEAASDVGALRDALLQTAQRVRRANGRLERSDRRMRELLQSMSEGFVVVDRHDRIRYANPAFADMLGVPVASIVGMDLPDFLDEENRIRVRRQTEQRKDGVRGRYELTWLRPDGSSLVTLVSASPLFGARGRHLGSFGVITDLTGRRRLERQMLRVIEKASLEGAETVRRILEFSRTKPGGDPEVVHVDDLVGEVLDLLRYREEARSGQHRIRRGLRARRSVNGHPGELREALLNLLVNSLDAMPEGGDLVIRTRDRGHEVEIRITDSGHGMDPETLERALDPFFTTRGVRRTGLGLPLAWGIVRRHGGRIGLASEPGRGTVVTVKLPTLAAEVAEKPDSPEDTRGRRALVVDDEESILRMLRFALGQRGYRVENARTGPEGLKRAIDADEFDVLVTDLRMPGVSGTLIAEEARRTHPGLRVVVITGAGPDEIREAERNPAVDCVLAKPFDLDQLEEALGLAPSQR